MINFLVKCFAIIIIVFGVHTPSAYAEPLSSLLPDFLINNNQYRAAQSDAEAASESVLTARGAFYPTLDVTGTYGNERQLKPDAADTSMTSREIDFIFTQRLWNFGATDATVNTARLQHEQTIAVLGTTRSSLLLRAFSVYMNVIRAAKSLTFALQSEENVKK